MKRIVISVISLAVLLSFAACGSAGENRAEEPIAQQPLESDAPSPTESPAAFRLDESGMLLCIDAAGLTLKFPAKWSEKLVVENEENKVSFFCEETPLFAIILNGEEGTVQGTVLGEAEASHIVVSAEVFPITGGNEELYQMRDDMNVIFQNLEIDYDFTSGETIEPEETGTFDIVTPVVTLQYPAKWEDRVQIEITDERASFSSEGVPLFDLIFAECDGYKLGTYGETPVFIIDYPVENDEQTAMKEDVNVILMNLMEDPAFILGA